MNAPEKFYLLPDVQATPDQRQLAIQRVGVKGLRYPVAVAQSDERIAQSVATFAMYVGLPADEKGTHMSRFVEILERSAAPLSLASLRDMLAQTLRHLDAEWGCIEVRLPYFLRKRAPVSGVESLLDIDLMMTVETDAHRSGATTLQVTVPVTSLCPCSKEISDYGAHNQRSHITLTVTLRVDMSVEELVRIAEDEASCEVYGLLKRPDEKYVTERAYDNPKFVEDLVRDIALRLKREPRVASFVVESENFESIHNHSAYARIDGRNG